MSEVNAQTADGQEAESVVCYCAGVSRQQIQVLLQQGVTDFERISRITGACSGCGGCEFEVTELINATESS